MSLSSDSDQNQSMLKLVINSPKGGVGKTTIATNAALLLASQEIKVLALDLAGGLRMSKYIRNKQAEDAKKYGNIEIREAEYEELPDDSIRGGRNYQVMIADTDDYYKILENLCDPKRKGWRAIAPIIPDDTIGLERIAEELGAIATAQAIARKNIPIRILPNRCGREQEIETDLEIIRTSLEQRGIAGLMSQYYIYNSKAACAPIFIEQDEIFQSQLQSVLSEVGLFK